MIHAIIQFRRPGLEDAPQTRAMNINELEGHNCARWLRESLADTDGYAIDPDPIPEDWGWALCIGNARDRFVLGCTRDEDSDDGWIAQLGDNALRGLLPATRRRRTETLEQLTQRVEAFLKAQPDVTGLAVQRQ
jgi:hypothetical protein